MKYNMSVSMFFVLIHTFVVLCRLVGSTFSININEWAQAEKCLAGWARPVTDWRWSCAVRSGQLWVEVDQLWHRQKKRRRWTYDVAASNSGWMMSVQYLCNHAAVESCAGAARAYTVDHFLLLPLTQKASLCPLSPPFSTFLFSLFWCFVNTWYGFLWEHIFLYTFLIFMH